MGLVAKGRGIEWEYEPGKRGKRFWPDANWRKYWQKKRTRCREKGIDFTLTREECLALTEELIACNHGHPIHPSRDGMHLGRIDHSKGYVSGNVQWESYLWNVAKATRGPRK